MQVIVQNPGPALLIFGAQQGPPGPAGSDATVNAANIASAIAAFDGTQAAAARGRLNAVGYDPASTVLVNPSGTDAERGVALAAAYAAAKLLTPGGSALSATNRATVLLPVGKYYLSAALVMDANYVDIAAVTPSMGGDRLATDDANQNVAQDLSTYRPPLTVVYTDVGTINTIQQTVADIRLHGFGVVSLSATKTTGTHAFFCSVTGEYPNRPSRYSMMYFYSRVTNYGFTSGTISGVGFAEGISGMWMDCISGNNSWRMQSTATKKFTAQMYDCQGGPYSFVGDATNGSMENALFIRCKCIGIMSLSGTGTTGHAFAGCGTFATPIDAGTVFIDCESGDRSFGMGKTCAGTFIRCRGGKACFGGGFIASSNGVFSGYAEDCYALDGSFGGFLSTGNGYLSGTLVRCTIVGNTKTLKVQGGKIRDSRITVATTGTHALTLLDSTASVSNTDIIVFQGGTGIPIYAASALNVVAHHLRMNNAANDANGLDVNVTNLIASPSNVVSDAVT